MNPRRRLKPLEFAVPALMTLGSAAVLLATGSRSPDARDAAGVFPPWWTRSEVLTAAGAAGQVRDLGAAPFVIVIHAPEGQAAARLRRAGALFTVAPAGSATCAS